MSSNSKFVKRIFNFYIRSSLHVSLAILSLTLMTYKLFDLRVDYSIVAFTFFSAVVGYNYTKYGQLLLKKRTSPELKAIQIVTFVSVLCTSWIFISLQNAAQLLVVVTGVFTLFYALSFFGHRNLRNSSGIKIYIVALCWVLTTLLLPLFQADFPINSDVLIKSTQRFLLVIILILIFEIIDLKEDAPNLKTVPQTIGVKRTKILGISLLVLFFLLEFLLTNYKISQFIINGVLAVITILFTLFASDKRSKYYTSFWVESIPILWFLMVVVFRE